MICCRHNRIRINHEMTIKIINRPGLPEMFYPQRRSLMPFNRAYPGQGRRMTIRDCNQQCFAGHALHQTFNLAER